MSTKEREYIARTVIQHLDGNIDLFQHYVRQAQEEYSRYKHLYVSIADRMKARESA